MSNKIIRSLFESRLRTWALGKGLPVAWENTQHTPPAGPYAKCEMLKAPTYSLDLEGDHRAYTGLFQVSLFGANGSGAGAIETLAQELDALFSLNLRLTSGAVTVQIITPCSEGPAIQSSTHYMIPVSFGYRADTV